MKKHHTTTQRLLDRVCYLSREASKDTDLFGNEITVKHTFPYNPDSKTAPETAERWSGRDHYDPKTRQYVKGPEPERLERANDPFHINIIDLDVRSEGGRAYKVVDSDGRCFDLREDQVLEVFKHCGIHAGGWVPGQFVWGILGNQVRMVLVNGDLHTEMIKQAKELKEFKHRQASGQTPTEGSLQAGRVYRKRDQSLHLFLGRVKAPGAEKASFAFVSLPSSPPLHEDPRDLEYFDNMCGYSEHAKHRREERAIAQRWDTMTWAERCQWEWHDNREWLQRQYKDQVEPGYYHRPGDIVLMSSPKFEEEVNAHAPEFAWSLRVNSGCEHKYVNGKGDDLAEEHFKAANGGEERQWHYGYRPGRGYDHFWYGLSDPERKKHEKAHRDQVTVEFMKTREGYRSALKWL